MFLHAGSIQVKNSKSTSSKLVREIFALDSYENVVHIGNVSVEQAIVQPPPPDLVRLRTASAVRLTS